MNKKKKVVFPSPLPFQCCLKQNVNISIWIDKSGFVVSLLQDPAMAPGYVAFPFLYTWIISLETSKEAPSPKCNCQSSLCLQACPISPARGLWKALAASSRGLCVTGGWKGAIFHCRISPWELECVVSEPIGFACLPPLPLPSLQSSPNFCCPSQWEPAMRMMSLQGA